MTSGSTTDAEVKPVPSTVVSRPAEPATPSDVQVEPPAQPVAASEIAKMPLPPGRGCVGKYTDEARANATEGLVVLDLIVDEDGRTRDITVVQGLPHGLTEAAVNALKQCRFTPGQKNGNPVAVRVRGFKIWFLMSPAK